MRRLTRIILASGEMGRPMDLEQTSGEELQGQIKEIIRQPREVIDPVKKA